MNAPAKINNGNFNVQYGLNWTNKIVIDLFAGGGGASTGLELGLKRTVAAAINHNPRAISMHTVNHPNTRHFVQDVFAVDPFEATQGLPVGWMHASPDCTHHSQAAGGQPRSKEIRDLSWVVCKFGGTVKPDVISLENVKQILNWSPLVAKRCKETGRVVTLDRIEAGKGKTINRVAEPGEHVPRDNQFLVPDHKRKGKTWKQFVKSLESLGYQVEWRILKACDFGAPTTRERLFMVARCDGHPIVWPEPTHFKDPKRGQKKWRAAHECIDWADLGKSIFDRPKPLAEATMRRVAKGLQKFVIDAKDPFIVPSNGVTPFLTECANASNQRNMSVNEPLSTICAKVKGGHHALVSGVLAPYIGRDFGASFGHNIKEPLATTTANFGGHSQLTAPVLVKFRGDSIGDSVKNPLPTITSGGNAKRPAGAPHALGIASACLIQANGGFNTVAARDMREPMSTITNTGSQQQLMSAVFTQAFYGEKSGSENRAGSLKDPLRTITTENRHALISATLSKEHLDGALRVATFLINFYGNGDCRDIRNPLDTITTKDRLALVTVWIKGEPWVIVDIRLRMLQPRELYRAQGFPDDYVIDRGALGEPMTKTEQVFMVGNSVSPYPMEAIARANDPWRMPWRQAV